MLAEAPKDGHLYLFDLNSGQLVYKKPVTNVANAEAPMTAQGTRFCPGAARRCGVEWCGVRSRE